MPRRLNVAVLGCGFMGRAHSNAWHQVSRFFDCTPRPVLTACYGREENREALARFAERWGYASFDTDWQRIVERDDIDLVDVCVPNHMHRDIVLAAAQAGKMVLCEKPLAMNASEGEEMVRAVAAAGVPNLIWFNYRRVPALALARQIVDEGRVGRAFHYRATYDQDYAIGRDVPQGGRALWRLDAAVAGSGVVGDLLAHAIDLAEWLNGPIDRVVADVETFVEERRNVDTGAVEPVEVDDACAFLARFDNGSLGTFESTRFARGRKNANTLELNGERGALYFDLEDPHVLQFYRYLDPATGAKVEDHLAGWQRIHATAFEHPYMDRWWVPGCTVGYEHTFTNTLADFLAGLESGRPAEPTLAVGLRVQRVCDAVLESARSGSWVTIGSR